MQRDPAYLKDILDSALMAVKYVADLDFEEFAADGMCQDAVIRRLEIIGEAARRISDETKEKYKHLPWREMQSMRNLLIHEYDEVDVREVWNTIKTNLPPLISELQQLI